MSRPTTPSSHPLAPRRVQPSGATTEHAVSAPPSIVGGTPPVARRQIVRVLAAPLVSVAVYFAVRPPVGSDAAALAVAGVLPAAYAIAVALVRRRAEPWAVLTSAGFAVGCIVSLLAGGSSLPLKLHEASVTFVLGTIVLVAALFRRPLPVGRVLKVPRADAVIDTTLSVMVGSFLVLHALLHLALAVILSTSGYLIAGRVVSWATLGVGALCLYAYLRRLRRAEAERRSASDASTPSPPRER